MTTCVAAGPIQVLGPEAAFEAIRQWCGQGQPIDHVEDTFTALERLAGSHTHALFVWVASLPSRADGALASLRQMLSPEGRMILIARPDEEPRARQLLSSGADEYLIWPLRGREVSRVLGLKGRGGVGGAESSAPFTNASSAGLVELAEVLRYAESDMGACLDRLAALVCERLHARSCTVEVPDALSVCGEPVGEPVLSAEMDLGQGRKGKLAVGPGRHGAYSAAEKSLLEGYAAATGVVLRLALSGRYWQQLALTDELTGLVNRRGLMLRLPEILEISRRQRTTVTLLLFDIDDFKHYNDAYSHDLGDEILREAGRLFTMCVRQHDIVARYGGDEFVVVFWEADEPRKAGSKPTRDVLAVLNRFRESLVKHEFHRLGHEAKGMLTISGGLVTFPWDAGTPEELIARADEALLLAKRQGKNRIWLVGDAAVRREQ